MPERLWDTDRDIAERFVRDFSGARSRVRTALVHEQVTAFLPDRPCRIVDVGAGSGQQALPLARAGHEVTLVEPSPIMVEQAQLAIEACDADVRGRVTVVRADAEAAVSLLPGEFDAVLCHGVLMYLPDPAPVLAALARLCRPGGIVSVLTKNSGALAMRHGLQADFATALACFEAEDSIGWLGVRTRGDTLDGLTRLLAAHDVMVEEWFGVGVFSDHRSDLDALDESGYRLLEQAELVAARTDPYRAVARLIHVVGRRAAR